MGLPCKLQSPPALDLDAPGRLRWDPLLCNGFPSTLKFWTAPGLTFANFLKYRGMQEHLIQLRVGLMGQPRQRQTCRL